MSETMIRKNHMDVLWHEYTDKEGQNLPIVQASLTEKASIIGRAGIMLLSCGTGAWRVRSSMNTLAEVMGVTCTADIGLMSIEYTCFDGQDGFTQSLCLTNTGVNTSKLNRLEHFIQDFETEGKDMSGEQLHNLLDNIEEIHGLYSPIALGIAAALACGGFTFLLGGGPIEMFCAFVGAGLGNFLRCKLTKHHYTLFLGIVLSVSLACLSYAGLLKLGEIFLGLSVKHEAGYICAMLFIIPGFPFITSGIDLAKLDMRSGIERLGYALIIILVATMSAWIMALILHLQPVDFIKISLPLAGWINIEMASWESDFEFAVEIPETGMEFGSRSKETIKVVDNDSTTSIGIQMTIIAEDTVVNPSIMNVTTGETLKLLCTMLPDDEIVITTEQGNIDVVLRRNGKEYDYNYTVDEDNEGYVQLETGRNYINYTADSGGDYMNVNFDFENRYVMP